MQSTNLPKTSLRPRARRVPFSEKLARLQLTAEQFQFYRGLFVQGGKGYVVREVEPFPPSDDAWVTSPYPLERNLVAKHLLADRRIYGSFTRSPYASWLCLDVDKPEHYFSSIQEAFPDGLTIRSSASGHLHHYVFFNFKVHSRYLHQITTERLRRYGVTVRPGHVEVFPRPNRASRLPLGFGSRLLDREGFIPVAECVADAIALISRDIIFALTLRDVFDDDADEEQACCHPQVDHGAIEQAHPETLHGKEFKAYIARLLRDGLWEEGQRHQAQLKLIFHYWSSGISEAECEAELRAWYTAGMTNGLSKDWSRRPTQVLRELAAAVRCHYRTARERGYTPRQRIIPEAYQRVIQGLTDHPKERRFMEAVVRHLYGYAERAMPRNLVLTFPHAHPRNYARLLGKMRGTLIEKTKNYCAGNVWWRRRDGEMGGRCKPRANHYALLPGDQLPSASENAP